MLISETQERGEIHKLLSQTHILGVDYSLFIMETVEMSLGGDGDHADSAPPEFPPLQSAAPDLCFGVSVFSATSPQKAPGDYFYSRL